MLLQYVCLSTYLAPTFYCLVGGPELDLGTSSLGSKSGVYPESGVEMTNYLLGVRGLDF